MSNVYATHTAFLQEIGRVLNPRRVLEIGAGYYSTGTFLDRGWFPGLELLDSVETQHNWRTVVGEMFRDKRLKLYAEMPGKPLSDYDLIFVDDGQSALERVKTIEALVQARVTAPVVIHDFENPYYRHAADFDWLLEYASETPHTALLWNGDVVSAKQKEVLRDRVPLI